MLSKEVFVKGMYQLAAAHPDFALTEATIEVYQERLAGLSEEIYMKAIGKCLDTCKWFPKISEILGAVRSFKPSAIDAWQRLLAAAEANTKPEMDFATQKALDFIGGWEQFGLTTYENLRFAFKAFKDAYNEAQEQESRLVLAGGEQAALPGPEE